MMYILMLLSFLGGSEKSFAVDLLSVVRRDLARCYSVADLDFESQEPDMPGESSESRPRSLVQDLIIACRPLSFYFRETSVDEERDDPSSSDCLLIKQCSNLVEQIDSLKEMPDSCRLFEMVVNDWRSQLRGLKDEIVRHRVGACYLLERSRGEIEVFKSELNAERQRLIARAEQSGVDFESSKSSIEDLRSRCAAQRNVLQLLQNEILQEQQGRLRLVDQLVRPERTRLEERQVTLERLRRGAGNVDDIASEFQGSLRRRIQETRDETLERLENWYSEGLLRHSFFLLVFHQDPDREKRARMSVLFEECNSVRERICRRLRALEDDVFRNG
jgi:hypothetical protein